ncbi:MAG TPA: DUF2723 domain-containing protein, partial [Longimicrobiales bacterium]|nr:DUF2723 domain-containing protein [Longimicrobiales bacterium]
MMRGGSSRLERAVFGWMLRAYPAELRAAHAPEMEDVCARMCARAGERGSAARAAMWLRIAADTMRSAPVEHWHAWRERARDRAATATARGVPAPDYAGAVVASLGVFLLYLVTLAPTTAFWDAGEYITVAHVVGIPHPPGNPLFVMIARAWDVLLSVGSWPVAVRINVLSAVCSALAHLFLFLLIERSLRPADTVVRRVGATCAVLMSATAFTVWHQSNVNEKVYTLSFLTTMLVMWLALRWRDTRNTKLLVAAAYITVLSATNHLMGVLVAPAVLLFVYRVDRGALFSRRVWATTLPLAMLALSAQLFLPIRAAERPVVNESDPTCESLLDATVSIYTNGARGCEALSSTLTREQYGKPSIFTDPATPAAPRGAKLIASQFVNYVQYLDWQWARSVAGTSPLLGGARPIVTLLVLLLVAVGARAQWRVDRNAALMHGAALAMLSVALVLYLNFKWGFSIARDAFPDVRMHEVRERDYFFLIGFSLWGAWAGLGIAALWRAVSERTPRLAAAPILALALIPMALNWSWASRADDWTARDWAYNVLMSVEPYGVLVTNGDNDSFPLWYLQHVEHVREDVTIVLSPYLATPWYARQIRNTSRPCAAGEDPLEDRTTITCQRPLARDSVHPRLLTAWGDIPDSPPNDSVLPYDDAELDTMAGGWFIAQNDLEMRFGDIETVVGKGTTITPIDTFVAAIVQSSYGERPIHFMTPSPVVARLGLSDHVVRVGLTWKLREPDDRALVSFPFASERRTIGAYVDRTLTDTLARDVFIVRGRVTDPEKPWVDHSNYMIPAQYAIMHYAGARAAELEGD